ncbi:MAG: carbohydrate binding domain-containing protein, partial [Bacteroidota bacterium]|nr:carbohydrate binding domain-containing protein [Bacteroidota bacterium]
MKNTFLILLASGLSVCTWAQQAAITLDVQNKGISISPVHHGIFFEDINHAADGGLYAELIRNRSFEDAATPEYWTVVKDVSASLTASLVNTDLLNTAQSQALCLKIFSATATYRAGISNAGFWGMNVVDGREYTLSFFAKCDTMFKGNVTATLESTDGTHTYAKAVIPSLSTDWKKYTCKLTASGNDKAARLVLSFHAKGTVYLDVVSLFPPTFNNRKNGLRPDLAQLLLDMKPKFVRFPGGCFIEGDVLANRFQWKKSIGPIEERPGHNNLWGYRTSDGMGFDEFLQLSEDIGAEPLFVVNVGIAHNDFVTGNDLKPYIQDALDAIEYANGAVTTVYGALRASNGHPEPYGLKYMEIGNENYYSPYYSAAYCQFYDSIKAHYPAMKLIGDVAAWGTDSPTWDIPKTADLVDEHYYRNPAWFINEYAKYDSYSRTGPGIY